MKRIRCPKCDKPVTFDEAQYAPGRTLVFECPVCRKPFKIRIPPACAPRESDDAAEEAAPRVFGYLTVVENQFHYKQQIPLYAGRNVVGRFVNGTRANAAIKTTDPSIDTTHCVVTVRRTKAGAVQFVLQDAPSNTGTFLMNTILADREQAVIEDGAIITIGATTLILHTEGDGGGEGV